MVCDDESDRFEVFGAGFGRSLDIGSIHIFTVSLFTRRIEDVSLFHANYVLRPTLAQTKLLKCISQIIKLNVALMRFLRRFQARWSLWPTVIAAYGSRDMSSSEGKCMLEM